MMEVIPNADVLSCFSLGGGVDIPFLGFVSSLNLRKSGNCVSLIESTSIRLYGIKRNRNGLRK